MSLPFGASPWPFTSPHPENLDQTFEREPFLAYLRRFGPALPEDYDSSSGSNSDSGSDSDSAPDFDPSFEGDQDQLRAKDNGDGNILEHQALHPGRSTELQVVESLVDDVGRFMQGHEGDAARLEHRDQVQDVVSFVKSRTRVLEDEREARPRYIAIVDTRGAGCWASCSGPHRGGLTESELNEKLRFPV